jgi:type VI secretion system protein VasJ
LQWYIHQALTKSGQETLADIIAADLKGLLSRLSGLETLAFSDGTPFADEVTLNWIQQSVLDTVVGGATTRHPPRPPVTMTFWRWSRKPWRWPTVKARMPRWAGCRPDRA